ncbi:MAG: bifunctional 3'-5' exonuclease/DNA polymerase, partial [Cellulomonadaceae bacterium]|nr:bifunctional 3'-5' exonuclease/DNA polymerase [Cellulomonadaceae bacterium]
SALALAPPGPWDAPTTGTAHVEASLFDDLPVDDAEAPDPLVELAAQLDAVACAAQPGRLRLLLAAESTGALIAAEMRHDGMPWSVEVHDALLTATLGERPRGGGRPTRLDALATEVRALLDQPSLNPDSQPDLLRALRTAGLDVTSTRVAEIRACEHPVVEPLLEYKKLARLLSANGWAWMQAWVHDGRFRPDYVPGGVVTGRWATSGGGALQLPAAIRGAVRADPGWCLVVADAAQLEPRVLAAMSGDGAMAAAGQQADLYQGVVDAGIVETRTQAKYAMLGAIYGATTGASATLMPQLTRAYPRAVALVEAAARAGERGEVVSTWLGRSSPRPGAAWQDEQLAAVAEGAESAEVREARRRRRDWGRFTRNFVVQGTAAEWALCWMASLRRRLAGMDGRPHLVFFLHDEVMVHAPLGVADEVAAAVRDAATEAGVLLFGATPVEFALGVAVVDSYDQAK